LRNKTHKIISLIVITLLILIWCVIVVKSSDKNKPK